MFSLASLLLGIGLSETYNRTILRRRASRNDLLPPKLLSAQSGVTFPAMARVTFFNPLKILITKPIVLLISITLTIQLYRPLSIFHRRSCRITSSIWLYSPEG